MNIEMKKNYVKAWLDYQIETYKRTLKHNYCVDGINTISLYNTPKGQDLCVSGIHINNILKVAEILGLSCKKFDFDYEYDEYQIVYNGVIFYGLEETKNGK